MKNYIQFITESSMNKYIKSPLNYTGGKYKLLDKILPLFPNDINTFVDLFAGGCNVGVNVKANKVIFNDNLTYLIHLYKEFQLFGYARVLKHIEERIEQYQLSPLNKDGYNELRNNYNTNHDILDLFVLICYSFNHQIRFNNKHEFNTSFGKVKGDFNNSIKKNLELFINEIQNKKYIFNNQDFYNFNFDILGVKDFIYIDPLYLITTGSYNDGKRGFKGWTTTEEKQLLDTLIKLNFTDTRFALSNVIQHKGKSNEMLINFIDEHKLKVNYLDYTYFNSNYHTLNRDRNSSTEVLITNY